MGRRGACERRAMARSAQLSSSSLPFEVLAVMTAVGLAAGVPVLWFGIVRVRATVCLLKKLDVGGVSLVLCQSRSCASRS